MEWIKIEKGGKMPKVGELDLENKPNGNDLTCTNVDIKQNAACGCDTPKPMARCLDGKAYCVECRNVINSKL